MKLMNTYGKVKSNGKKCFDANDIVDFLMSEPFNLSQDNIEYTPTCVTVLLTREEYTSKRIGPCMLRDYIVYLKCDVDKLMIKPLP